MPAFGKNGIVNVNQSVSTDNWKVIKNGVMVGVFCSESDAKAYAGHLIVSGVNQNDIKIEKANMRCI